MKYVWLVSLDPFPTGDGVWFQTQQQAEEYIRRLEESAGHPLPGWLIHYIP